MIVSDEFSLSYKEFLDGTYDCVDRIVLNGYFILGQSGGGFRNWWRQLMGTDDNLDKTHLMRMSGHFSRRIHAYAKKNCIPLIHCKSGERKHEIAKQYSPKDPEFRGVFCILVGRAPSSVVEVQRTDNGGIDIRRKSNSFVNQYSFHIMDPEWGHLTIKLCPHPPFNVQILLNGHEFVARQAIKKKISFVKEGNCFTEVNDSSGLAGIADTMRTSSSVGRLVQVCNRWIYSACLCFALSLDEQERSGFHYSYSVYQVEYSRNLLFERGRIMDQVFQNVIDRTRSMLDIKAVKTIYGYKNRPFKKKSKKNPPRIETVVEKPVYDLTVFKVHFGKLTVKLYSKGERVLRVEAIAHNTKALRCGKVIHRFPLIINTLKEMLERFLSALHGVDASLIDIGTLENWHLSSKLGKSRLGGININQPRTRAVMEAIIVLSKSPQGFTSSELAEKVRELWREPTMNYLPRQASYDLKKFRGKKLVHRIGKSRRYEPIPDGLRAMVAFILLRQKVVIPLVTSFAKKKRSQKFPNQNKIDIHYQNIQAEMQQVFNIIGIAA